MATTYDPFRELDRLTQQVFGTSGTLARPAVMPMDAWRDGDTFHVEFDLPGVNPDSIDLDVERNVITVRAERPPRKAAFFITSVVSLFVSTGEKVKVDTRDGRYLGRINS